MNNANNLNVDRNIILFAFRYSLGRESYAPKSVMDAIKTNIDNISTSDILMYIKEIDESESYGMPFDKRAWFNFKEYLEEVLSKRK